MSNPLLKTKLPYIDDNNSIEDVVNYIVKTVNGSYNQDIGDIFPIDTIVQSSLSEKDFMSKIGSGWSFIGSVTIGTTTVNNFIKKK